uniref:Uncharacterized protein n=1 Tax=Candidatus Kentrum eta TaxID=2126337 RepID=A0A450UTW3_9GAMM|nr:MAG: hypothetical protein BECKH772A_GA0070896_100946 [Candidatus Kentron sp. H]VFJ96649.1 MAG: hypothetical protein BECKH772B_GA0070898_100956 [Candidatus Kentron sp. H]VFK02479.1 MAG: hypothetical protein BECKH772C_GA0070978_100926 [Candidatus Kentron sp. H]
MGSRIGSPPGIARSVSISILAKVQWSVRSCLEIRNLPRRRPNRVLLRCDGDEVRSLCGWASCSPLQSLIFAPIAPCGSHNRGTASTMRISKQLLSGKKVYKAKSESFSNFRHFRPVSAFLGFMNRNFEFHNPFPVVFPMGITQKRATGQGPVARIQRQ